ncbi:MAG: RNA ligase, Rnl2 family [Candidatus Aminicenantes bacterium]|nr:RNA ligase, Rnl2 family [Candidatus Aminicenantes bacterium]NIM80096.1 RNA ligase, Rnl2 family [Candidatus Aminicenantes bacterium]NIN19434.1 RNA ligase, Rnl2 family [Candidatus Aminicenantes bacterium]NIN43334.1 RNA ligase, Rnl2 family [Candidatus Aminicenantes bacterium]NIN86078.1 RNA ligase, Rnl2 family [Candidatus Aminicenantes bacterium]
MMKHIKYASIENTYRKEFLDMVKEENKNGGEWVVTEKVHGGQLSIYYDGSEIKASTRTAFLTEDIDFFNWQKVLADNQDKVKKLYDILKSKNKDISMVIVYGELFGGSYPHPEVPKVKTAKRLQKGVHYHPDNLLYVFDIRVDDRYLSVDECSELFEKAGLFYAKPVFRGTLEECLNHSNRFPSQVSQWLGLPAIEDNIAEGVVIKPVEPSFLKIGARVILKSKNEKFEERKAKKKRPIKQKEEIPLSETGERLLQELEALVTENRLQNVLSKRGQMPYPVPKNYFGEVMKEFSHDIWEEFNKDFEDAFDQLDNKEQKKISKTMNGWAAKLVKKTLFSPS